MKIWVINGPNLNFLGIREQQIYGTFSYESIMTSLQQEAEKRKIELEIRQSNHEGDLVDWIQQAYLEKADGLILNPAAYTHTSIALLDALKAVAPLPAIEVHLSAIYQRESFRHHSYTAAACIEQISGQGAQGYLTALDHLLQYLDSHKKAKA